MDEALAGSEVRPQPRFYEIRIAGHLDSCWADWFDGLSLSPARDGNTILLCSVVDQAALHGLLRKVRDLGLPLVSINEVEPNRKEESHGYVHTDQG